MKRLFTILLLATFALTSASCEQLQAIGTGEVHQASTPNNGQLIAILGDSNATGYGDSDKLDDRTLVSAYSSVSINEITGVADPFQVEHTISTRSLQPYDTGGVPGLGVELTLGRALYEAGRTPAICKWSSRGSVLANSWLPGQDYYSRVTAYLDARVTEFGTLGIVYLDLGGNDGGSSTTASAVKANYDTLIGALRARYGNFTVIVRQASSLADTAYAYMTIVREQQRAWVASDDNAVLIDVDDVPFGTDNLHFTANGYAGIGYRAANAVIDRLGPAPSVFTGPGPVYVGSVPGEEGTGELSPLSFPIHSVNNYVDVLAVASAYTSEPSAPVLVDPSGFKYVGRAEATNGGGGYQYLSIWYRRRTATHMGSPIVADNNNINAAKTFTFRQPTTMVGTPFDVTPVFTAHNTYDTTMTATGVTTGTGNDLVVTIWGNYGGAARTVSGFTNSSVGSLTLQQSNDHPIGSDHEVIVMGTGTKATAGATGTTTATGSGAMFGVAVTLAIKP